MATHWMRGAVILFPDTDTWKDNGGSTGSLREFAGLLIVHATPETHEKLKAFLDKLRGQLELGAGK